MGIEFNILSKAFGIKVEPSGNDAFTVTGPSGEVKAHVPKVALAELNRAASFFLNPDTGKSTQKSAARFADSANGKKLESAERFGLFIVKKFIPIVGQAVAADVCGANCKQGIDACIPEKKEVA